MPANPAAPRLALLRRLRPVRPRPLELAFGPTRVADVYTAIPTGGDSGDATWSRWLPARGSVRVGDWGVAVALTSDAIGCRPADLTFRTRHGVLSLLSVPGCSLDPAQLNGLLGGRIRVRSLDLSGIPATELTAWMDASPPRVSRLRHLRLPPEIDPRSGQLLCRRIGGARARADLAPQQWSAPGAKSDHARLEQLLAQAAARHPNAVRPDEEPDSAKARAEILHDAGRHWEALAAMGPLGSDIHAPGLLLASRVLLELQEHGAALAAADLAARDSSVASALAARSIVLAGLRLNSEALFAALDALRHDAHHGQALAQLVLMDLALGQMRNARNDLQAVEREQPDSWNMFLCRRAVARASGKRRATAEASRRLAELDPEDADALGNLARAEMATRPWSPAWSRAQLAATRSDPAFGHELRTLAVTHPRYWAGFAAFWTWLIAAFIRDGPAQLGVALGQPAIVAAVTYGLMRRMLPEAVRRATSSSWRSRLTWGVLSATLVFSSGSWLTGWPAL